MTPRIINAIALAAIAILVSADTASAAPVAAVLTALGTAFKAAIAVKALATAALRLLLTTGVSLLMKKYQQRKQRRPGIQTTHTTTGGTEPQASIVGRYATAGHLVYHNSHGDNRVYLTHVIELGDIPGASLRRLIIDGEYSDIGTEWDPHVGYQILSKYEDPWGYGWIRFIDGTQTAADPKLVELYGEDPDRPWTEDHILTGTNYAVLTFYRKDRIYPQGRPQVRFELEGPGFYDPRQDDTVGGNGDQRWEDRTSWARTDNLMVIAYNILRGITLPCGSIYGGAVEANDLPLEEWFNAMDVCDLLVGEDERPQFRGGYEIKFEEAPADILEELFSAANAEVVEVGGYWFPLVGADAVAAADIEERDLLVSESWQHDPFPGVESTFNAITVSHPSPNALWNSATLETNVMDDWVVEDGGQKLFDLRLPMVWDPAQARQLGQALLKENRRFRTHRWPLPPDYFFLRPLQTINVSLADYGYDGKSFRITEVAYDLLRLTVSVSLRETNPSDFDPDQTLELPGAPVVTRPAKTNDAGVPGFGVSGVKIKDVHGNTKSAGILTIWDASLQDTADGLSFEARIAGSETDPFTASTADLSQGRFRLEPMIGGADYEVRAKAIAKTRKTEWTIWLPVTTPEVKFGPGDFDDAFWERLDGEATAAVQDLYGNIEYALDRLAEVDLEGRAFSFLETARIEGEVTEKTEALSSEVDGVRAELVQNYVTAATQDAALATLQTTLSAQINGVSASLSTSYYTISQVNSAISAARTSLRSEIAGVSATLNADYYTIAETNSAISAATTSVTSTLGSLTTTVNQVQSSVDGIKGTYGVQVNNNGVVTGFGLVSELINGSVSTTFTVQADRFVVASSSGGGGVSPFLISGGKVYIRDAVIRNASISSAKIKALAVDTLHIKGKAVDTRQIAENAATTFYEATGGTGYKRIQIRNTHDEPITLIIQVLYDCQDDGGSAALFAGVKIYKEQTAGGKNNLLSSVGDGSTGGGEVAAADGTEVVTTTINPGITRYISAYPEGRVVRRCDMIILQRQR
ncbi:phage tail protein [Phaeobacter inhibens]|uniref:phage tail tip fiber protein n=1 Tax=Phaeobacter inhibens TaxID=221822 RepID=UPI00076BBE77|nr:phage tail protein [Phaeobacter inhibens]KXF92084.1 hypothetical protein AT574_03765 [Phaeobacter inhibens]WHP69917.1 phage tail protein [Phaeobacter inhibens]